MIAFRVYGNPKPQPRVKAWARPVGDGAIARVYDPNTADNWKGDVIRCGASVRPTEPIQHPISMHLRFLLKRPKRLMRKKDSPGRLYAPSKPDVDNLVKAVMDALQSDGWFRDDALIVRMIAEKWYAGKAEAPGAEIELYGVG